MARTRLGARGATAVVAALLLLVALVGAGSRAASGMTSSGRPEGPCAGLQRLPGAGAAACTHGVDRLPAGDAAHAAYSVSRPGFGEVTTPPGIPCYTRGPFVHVYYAYRQGSANHILARAPYIREAVAMADLIYQTSAARVGATRHVRWLTKDCHLVVTPFATRFPTFALSQIRAQLQAQHRIGRREKGLVFVDGGRSFGCFGIGELQPDNRASTRNRNNSATMIAAVDRGCTSSVSFSQEGGGQVAAHELGHTLGAVQPDAPHSNHNGHCVDEWDVMCYDDGSHRKLIYRCGAKAAGQGNPLDRLLDCNLDTYFNPKPARRSYLATHWNIATSSWLSSAAPTRWDVLARPQVSVVPTADGLLAGSQSVHVRADPSTAKVELYANGTDVGPATKGAVLPDGGVDFVATLPTSPDMFGAGYPSGTVLSLTAGAADAIGRTTLSAAVSATVANPTVTLTAPVDGSPLATPFVLTWAAAPTAAGGRGIGAVSLLLQVNGAAPVTLATDTVPGDGWGGQVDLSAYAANGYVELAAQATDSGGALVSSPWSAVWMQ